MSFAFSRRFSRCKRFRTDNLTLNRSVHLSVLSTIIEYLDTVIDKIDLAFGSSPPENSIVSPTNDFISQGSFSHHFNQSQLFLT